MFVEPIVDDGGAVGITPGRERGGARGLERDLLDVAGVELAGVVVPGACLRSC